jgi:hypothetical protein
MVPVPVGVRTHSSSKSARCRPSSTRKQGNLCSSDKISSRSGQAEHSPEKRVIRPGTSSAVSLTMPGQGCPGLQRGQPESGCSDNTTSSNAGAIHHRGAAYPGRTQESPGGCRGPTGRKLYLPKARVPPGASRNDFPTHAGGLGPHRAHAGRDACSPGSPRQRAPPPRPSSPPRREGAPRLPSQAWGTLRQRGGSKPLARTTRFASLQPGHTTGTVHDPVPNPDYHHQVLGGNKVGVVACELPAGLPAGWNGR